MGRSGVPHVKILFISKWQAHPLLLMILMDGRRLDDWYVLLTVSKLSGRKQKTKQHLPCIHTKKQFKK